MKPENVPTEMITRCLKLIADGHPDIAIQDAYCSGLRDARPSPDPAAEPYDDNFAQYGFDDTYTIRCFLNEARMPTHTLTKEQANNFRQTAQHLTKYLTEQYKLDDDDVSPAPAAETEYIDGQSKAARESELQFRKSMGDIPEAEQAGEMFAEAYDYCRHALYAEAIFSLIDELRRRDHR